MLQMSRFLQRTRVASVTMNVESTVQAVTDWAKKQPSMQAVMLVGSHAQGTARDNSDIDIVMLTTEPDEFRTDLAWLQAVSWPPIDGQPQRWIDENYGVLWVRRLWLNLSGDEM